MNNSQEKPKIQPEEHPNLPKNPMANSTKPPLDLLRKTRAREATDSLKAEAIKAKALKKTPREREESSDSLPAESLADPHLEETSREMDEFGESLESLKER